MAINGEPILTFVHDHETNDLVVVWGGDIDANDVRELAREPHAGEGDDVAAQYARMAHVAGQWLADNFG